MGASALYLVPRAQLPADVLATLGLVSAWTPRTIAQQVTAQTVAQALSPSAIAQRFTPASLVQDTAQNLALAAIVAAMAV